MEAKRPEDVLRTIVAVERKECFGDCKVLK